MRIAFVQPTMSFRGGAQSLIVWLASALAARGHVVSILSLRNKQEIWQGDVDTSALRFVDIGPRSPWLFGKRVQSRLLVAQVRSLLPNLDVICANNFPSTWWLYDAIRNHNHNVLTAVYCHEPNRATYFAVTDSFTVESVNAQTDFPLPNHELFYGQVISMTFSRMMPHAARSVSTSIF